MATIILSFTFAKVLILFTLFIVATIILGTAGMFKSIIRTIKNGVRGL